MMRRLTLSLFAALTVLTLPAAASASLTRIGTVPAVPVGAKALTPLSGATTLNVTIALQPRDAAALKAFATAVSTPGTAQYKHYLTVGQFAARFGATPAAISAVRSALQIDGLQLRPTTANGLTIQAVGTVAQLERAFSVTFTRYRLHGGRIAFATTTAPAVSTALRADIQSIVGLSSLYLPHSLLSHAALRRAAAAAHAKAGLLGKGAHADAVPSGAANPCTAATTAATGDTAAALPGDPLFEGAPVDTSAYTSNQYAQAYDYNPLYRAGDLGQGVTVAIYELEPNFHDDITQYEKCYGTNTTVNYVPVDGGNTDTATSQNEDGLETELDIENVIGLAPDVTVDVYQTANSDPNALDQYEKIMSSDTTKVVSTSWGECETLETSASAMPENTVFQEAASQGQSIVAAAGDSGAYDCSVEATIPVDAVDDPASQPFVTGAGGTSLETLGDPDGSPATPPTETVWNNGPALTLSTQGGGGGGGISSLWAMPSYQAKAATFLGVTSNAEASGSPCSATTGDCRAVPDVTASADLYTGAYLVYWNGSFTTVGGTSGAAPLWASLLAEADSDKACAGTVGFANADLYGVAGTSAAEYAKTFNDVTTGSNDVLTQVSPSVPLGSFMAYSDYDEASGLGSPNAANLIPALCHSTIALANPGAKTSAAGSATSVQLAATDPNTVTYSATGLPPGLTLNPSTGLISGSPTTTGTYSVTATASDAYGLTTSQTFTWTILSAGTSTTTTGTTTSTTTTSTPAPNHITLTAPTTVAKIVSSSVRIQLRGVDSAGTKVTYAATGLPTGLTISSTTGVISGKTKKAGRYAVTVYAYSPDATAVRHHITITIVGQPTITRYSLRDVAAGRPVVAFRITAGKFAGNVQKLTVRLPFGVSLARKGTAIGRYLTVTTTTGKHVRFAATTSQGHIVIALRKTIRIVSVTISAPGVKASRELRHETHIGSKARRSVAVTVHETSTLSAVLKSRTRAS